MLSSSFARPANVAKAKMRDGAATIMKNGGLVAFARELGFVNNSTGGNASFINTSRRVRLAVPVPPIAPPLFTDVRLDDARPSGGGRKGCHPIVIE
jgi:hypothetical protein